MTFKMSLKFLHFLINLKIKREKIKMNIIIIIILFNLLGFFCLIGLTRIKFFPFFKHNMIYLRENLNSLTFF
jgi:hypothetical protein